MYAAWQFMRITRWVLWFGFLGYSFYFVSDRAPHLTQFGNLTHATEFMIFGLPLAAVLAGFLELMLRGNVQPPSEGLKR